MAKKLQTIEWKAKINDKEYGATIMLNAENLANEAITEAVSMVSQQMTLSLQRIINGKNDFDIELEKAELSAKQSFKQKGKQYLTA